MLQLTDFHVHQLLGERVDVNYWYQEAFWYKICISSLHFPPPSSTSSLLLRSTYVFLNYRRSSSLSVPGGPRQNKGNGVCVCACVCAYPYINKPLLC